MTEELRQENETLRKQVLELFAQVEKMREVLGDCVCELVALANASDSDYARPDDSIIEDEQKALTIEPSSALQSYVNDEVAKVHSDFEAITNLFIKWYVSEREARFVFANELDRDKFVRLMIGADILCNCGGVITESKNSGHWICSKCGFDRTGTPD